MGKWKVGTKQRFWNQVNDRARVEVTFCSHFSFSRSSCSLLVLVTFSRTVKKKKKKKKRAAPLAGGGGLLRISSNRDDRMEPFPPPFDKTNFQKALNDTTPIKILAKILLPKKIPNWKLSNPQKSFDHPCHLKSGVPPPSPVGCSTCKVVFLPLQTFLLFCPSRCLFAYTYTYPKISRLTCLFC